MNKVVLVAFAILISTVVGSQIASKSQEEVKVTQVDRIEKTQKQKEHGKLFRHGGRSLLSLTADQRGEVTVVADPPLSFSSNETTTTAAAATSSASFLESAACNADAVVVGVLESEKAQFNEGETFIFTDYGMKVEEIIKDNPKSSIQINSLITVTRDGGVLKLNGRTFRALKEDFKPFTLDRKHLMLLRFVPSTGSYLASAKGSFLLNDNKIGTFGSEVPHNIPKDETTLLAEIRNAVAKGCGR